MGTSLCTLVNGVPTLVNGVPPLHFGEWGPSSFALWGMGSPLSTMVNGVPPLNFGEWGPPFALW